MNTQENFKTVCCVSAFQYNIVLIFPKTGRKHLRLGKCGEKDMQWKRGEVCFFLNFWPSVALPLQKPIECFSTLCTRGIGEVFLPNIFLKVVRLAHRFLTTFWYTNSLAASSKAIKPISRQVYQVITRDGASGDHLRTKKPLIRLPSLVRKIMSSFLQVKVL